MKNDKTMKVLVLKRFRDKYDKKTRYQPGEVVDFSEDRAKSLVERGLAKAEEVAEESAVVASGVSDVKQQDDAGKADDAATATDVVSADEPKVVQLEPKPEAGVEAEVEPEAKVKSEPEPEPKPKAKSKPKAKEK